MTLKSYLRMLLAAVTLLFVTSGCNDDDDKVGPPPSYSFSVAVSDVAQTEATVTVTPSNDQATYYYAAVKKAEFDTFESDAAYAQHILDNLKAIADKKVLPLSEYLATALVKGSAPQKITDLTAGTDYYAVALGMLTDGRFTSDLVKEAFKTDDAPEPAPELTLSMRAGDASGANTSSYVTCHIKSSDIVSAKAAFLMKSAVDKALAEGKTLAEILAGVTTDPTLKTEQVEKINSADGYDLPCRGVPAATAVTAIVSVTSANGKTTVDSASATTDAAQGGGDLTFTIAVTNIGAKGADVNITPSNDSDTYYFDIYPASVVDQVPDDNQLIAAIISANGGDVTKYLSTGPDGYSKELIEQYIPFDPETEYCVVAFGCNGTAGTTAVTKERFTTLADDGETGDGPALTLTMKAGDHTGADPTTKITCLIKSSGVVSAKAGLWTKATIDDAIGKGMSIEDIINNEKNGEAIEDKYMAGINGAGLNFTWGGASPATEYTAIIKVTDAAGNSTIKSATGATDAAGEATTVELKNLAQGEMQYWGDAYGIAENDYANWTIYLADATVDLSTLNGMGDVLMMELNTAKAVTTEITPGTYTVMPNRSKANFIAFSCVPGYVSGSTPYGTWYITEKSAKNMLTSGTVVVAKSGDNYTFTIDLLDQSTNTTFKGSYTGAMNYVNATAQSAQMRTPWANAANASKRSAFVSAWQNVVEVSAINSLSIEKPVAGHDATICSSGNFENAGLKKQISNNLNNNKDFQLLNRL